MKVIAVLVAIVTLLLTAFASYVVLQLLARGPLVEGAAILIGLMAAIAVRNAILARGKTDG